MTTFMADAPADNATAGGVMGLINAVNDADCSLRRISVLDAARD
jgi:hypothetical protein